LRVGGAITAGVAVYTAACLLLRLEEIGFLFQVARDLGSGFLRNITRCGR
jgi:hypothetical protein